MHLIMLMIQNVLIALTKAKSVTAVDIFTRESLPLFANCLLSGFLHCSARPNKQNFRRVHRAEISLVGPHLPSCTCVKIYNLFTIPDLSIR